MNAPSLPFKPTPADVEQYQRLRAASRRVNEQLVAAIPAEVLNVVAEQLGIRKDDGAIHLASEEVGALLMDTCIHGWPVGGETVSASFRRRQAETGRPRLSDLECQLLNAQVEAALTVFQVEQVVPGTGVYVKDGFTDDAFFLMDESMSQSPDAAGCWVSARLVTIGAWKMTTGAPVALGMLSAKQMRGKLRYLFDGVGGSEETRCAAGLALAAWSVDVTLASGPLPSSGGGLPVHPSKRPGRNQPCPCGSGLKVKHCCGR